MKESIYRGIKKVSYLTLVVVILSISPIGCFPLDYESPSWEEMGRPKYLTDAEIISLLRKGMVDWAEARTMFMSKGYTWWEAEMKLKARIPETEWIR
jgi:hypothetical protein